jgi:hypothetical protein
MLGMPGIPENINRIFAQAGLSIKKWRPYSKNNLSKESWGGVLFKW